MIVAIDGPSGAGKSSIAKIVAKKLGFSCLDTGAMYRAIAYKALQCGIDLNNDSELGKLADGCEISFGVAEGDPVPKQVFLDGEDITDRIRTSEIDKAVSPVSASSSVRRSLVKQQQKIGCNGDFVVEGRDIGSVVFPNAELKIFLTASPEERAHRRVRQNADRAIGSVDYKEVLQDIKRRDKCDSERKDSPLIICNDAIVIDSTDHYIEDVINNIVDLAKSKMK